MAKTDYTNWQTIEHSAGQTFNRAFNVTGKHLIAGEIQFEGRVRHSDNSTPEAVGSISGGSPRTGSYGTASPPSATWDTFTGFSAVINMWLNSPSGFPGGQYTLTWDGQTRSGNFAAGSSANRSASFSTGGSWKGSISYGGQVNPPWSIHVERRSRTRYRREFHSRAMTAQVQGGSIVTGHSGRLKPGVRSSWISLTELPSDASTWVILSSERGSGAGEGSGIFAWRFKQVWCLKPAVQTLDVPFEDLAPYSATVRGQVTDTGHDNPERLIRWRKQGVGSWQDVSLGVGSTGVYSLEITGLDVNETYEFRAVARNASLPTFGEALGDIKTFTTTATLPDVSTYPPFDITYTGVTGRGRLLDDGAAATEVGLGIRLAGIPGRTDVSLGYWTPGTDFQLVWPHTLDFDTDYQIIAWAENSIGRKFGAWFSFTTLYPFLNAPFNLQPEAAFRTENKQPTFSFITSDHSVNPSTSGSVRLQISKFVGMDPVDLEADSSVSLDGWQYFDGSQWQDFTGPTVDHGTLVRYRLSDPSVDVEITYGIHYWRAGGHDQTRMGEWSQPRQLRVMVSIEGFYTLMIAGEEHHAVDVLKILEASNGEIGGIEFALPSDMASPPNLIAYNTSIMNAPTYWDWFYTFLEDPPFSGWKPKTTWGDVGGGGDINVNPVWGPLPDHFYATGVELVNSNPWIPANMWFQFQSPPDMPPGWYNFSVYVKWPSATYPGALTLSAWMGDIYRAGVMKPGTWKSFYIVQDGTDWVRMNISHYHDADHGPTDGGFVFMGEGWLDTPGGGGPPTMTLGAWQISRTEEPIPWASGHWPDGGLAFYNRALEGVNFNDQVILAVRDAEGNVEEFTGRIREKYPQADVCRYFAVLADGYLGERIVKKDYPDEEANGIAIRDFEPYWNLLTAVQSRCTAGWDESGPDWTYMTSTFAYDDQDQWRWRIDTVPISNNNNDLRMQYVDEETLSYIRNKRVAFQCQVETSHDTGGWVLGLYHRDAGTGTWAVDSVRIPQSVGTHIVKVESDIRDLELDMFIVAVRTMYPNELVSSQQIVVSKANVMAFHKDAFPSFDGGIMHWILGGTARVGFRTWDNLPWPGGSQYVLSGPAPYQGVYTYAAADTIGTYLANKRHILPVRIGWSADATGRSATGKVTVCQPIGEYVEDMINEYCAPITANLGNDYVDVTIPYVAALRSKDKRPAAILEELRMLYGVNYFVDTDQQFHFYRQESVTVPPSALILSRGEYPGGGP